MLKKNLKKQKIKKKKRNYFLPGFSLGEVLLSVFILASVLTVAVGLIAGDLRYMINSQDRVIASGLAQEGIELVMNIRDNNWEKGNGAFENGFPNDSSFNQIINYDSDSLEPGSRKNKLNINNNNFYTHNSGTETKFQRKIIVNYYQNGSSINNKNNADEAEIFSVVIWGNSFPSGTSINESNCNASTKCAFAKVTLTKWNG